MKSTRQEVYEAIDSERDYQIGKWKETGDGTIHSPEEWILLIEEYLDEAKHLLARGSNQTTNDNVMDIFRKVTAMGVACMEQQGIIPRI